MTFKRLLGIAMSLCAVALLVGSVGAGAARTPAKRAIDLSTNTAVKNYLRSHGISPRGVVIQRGAKNYAGPRCPGKGWTCTRSHRVVQVATGRGKNSFRCAFARCVVVQATKSLLATNTAKCIRTTGITQSCSITQSSTSSSNEAVVVEIASKSSGLTQNAAQTAQIVQTAGSGANTACVLQRTTIDGSTTARRGMPVTVTLDAHQSASITQNSHTGGNTVRRATESGACTTGDPLASPLGQEQTLTSTARGSLDITQRQNAAPNGPNMLLDIQQNQADGFHGSASGVNAAVWSQMNTLTALAISPVGSVTQAQSSTDGGIEANVNQFSTTPSVINAHQSETLQCERAATSGTPSCGQPQPALPADYELSQTQFGPLRKGPGSSQEGSDRHQFTVVQDSTQTAGAGAVQSNVVEGACHTDGNCTVDQATTVQGVRTTNHQSGQDIDTTTTCTGTECVPTCTGEDCVAPDIIFDGSPGTAAPPATLGPYTMTRFGADPQPLNTGPVVTSVNDPAGTIAFSPALNHSRVGNGWATWSHGYTGDVYWTDAASTITITLPSGTAAFYLYAEPNTRSPFNVTAMAQDGTTSGPISVDGNGGARYFGFYGIGGANLASITVTTDDPAGLGVGEFGISPPAAPPIT
jgi:hypothetical protein